MRAVVIRLVVCGMLYVTALLAATWLTSGSTRMNMMLPVVPAIVSIIRVWRVRRQGAPGCICSSPVRSLLLPLDVYSLGGIGGDTGLQVHYRWQALATGGLAILLLVGLRELLENTFGNAFLS